MPDKRIPDETPQRPFSEAQIDNAVLGYLLYGPSWPWSVDELARELGHEGNAIDSVRRLTRTGLVHRFDEFVIPTRRRLCRLGRHDAPALARQPASVWRHRVLLDTVQRYRLLAMWSQCRVPTTG
jgi:hypothetical protein